MLVFLHVSSSLLFQGACWNLSVFEASCCNPDCSKPALTCCNRDSSRVDFWVGKKTPKYHCNPPWIYGEGFQGITVSVSKIQSTILIMFLHHTVWFLIAESGFKTCTFLISTWTQLWRQYQKRTLDGSIRYQINSVSVTMQNDNAKWFQPYQPLLVETSQTPLPVKWSQIISRTHVKTAVVKKSARLVSPLFGF